MYDNFTYRHLGFGLLICLLGLGARLTAQLPDSITLEQVIQLAQGGALQVDAARVDLRLAELNYRLFQADLKPQLTGRANLPNFMRTSSEIVQPDGSIQFRPVSNNNSFLAIDLNQNIPLTGGVFFVRTNLQRFDDFENDFTSYNGVPFRIGLFQPLFGFNQLKWDQQIEPVRYREANKKYLFDLESVRLDVARLFFDLLIAYNDLEIAEANRNNNQTLYEIARERYELGKISDSDLLQLRVGLLSAQRGRQSAEQAVRLASSRLYNYLGLPYDGRLIRPLAPVVATDIPIDPRRALDEARTNRFEPDQFRRQLLEADAEIARAKGNGGFQASLSASVGFTRGAQDLETIYRDPLQEQLVQLQLSVPILDWGRQRNTVALSEAQKNFAERQVRQNELEFETGIQQAVAQFLNRQDALKIAAELQQLARERFRIARESYLLGAISVTELNIAQQEKDLAVRNYISTLSQYWQDYFNLRLLTLYDFQRNRPIGREDG